MNRRQAARIQLHVTPLYRRWHDHAQFDPASKGGARYWGRVSPGGDLVPIEKLEEKKRAYRAERGE